MFPKPFKVRSKHLTQSAKKYDGTMEPCTLRLPGVCLPSSETVVLVHMPGSGKGTGTKENDLHSAYGCMACHDVVDRRRQSDLTDAIILDACLRGLSETQVRFIEKGLLSVKGWFRE
jgi:hypothetical protein